MNLIKILSGWIVALMFFALWINAEANLKYYKEMNTISFNLFSSTAAVLEDCRRNLKECNRENK